MRSSVGKLLVLAIVVSFVFAAGCEEETMSGSKKDRLISAENIRLRDKLEQLEKQLEKQKELLGQCEQEKQTLQEQVKDCDEKSKQKVQTMMSLVLQSVGKETEKLRQENERLKAQIDELKK